MLLVCLLLISPVQSQGLVFENSSNAHYTSGPDGVTLRQGPGWLRLPAIMLDYELTFEYRLSDSKTDAGVIVRSWARPRSWPDGGYRLRLPAADADVSKGLLSGHRANVETVRQPVTMTSSNSDGWRRIQIKAERERIAVTVDGADGGEYRIESVGGRVLFDVKRGAVELRNISVTDLDQVESSPPPDIPVAGSAPDLTLPTVIFEMKPEYTREAMLRRVEGIVEIQAVVLPDGTVGLSRVTKSLDPDLDRAALAAARLWRFRPGSRSGRAVPVVVFIEMTFELGRK